jgi:hypothetical protein
MPRSSGVEAAAWGWCMCLSASWGAVVAPVSEGASACSACFSVLPSARVASSAGLSHCRWEHPPHPAPRSASSPHCSLSCQPLPFSPRVLLASLVCRHTLEAMRIVGLQQHHVEAGGGGRRRAARPLRWNRSLEGIGGPMNKQGTAVHTPAPRLVLAKQPPGSPPKPPPRHSAVTHHNLTSRPPLPPFQSCALWRACCTSATSTLRSPLATRP